MADSNLQRSVTTATARRLATTTKTAPQMGSITCYRQKTGNDH